MRILFFGEWKVEKVGERGGEWCVKCLLAVVSFVLLLDYL